MGFSAISVVFHIYIFVFNVKRPAVESAYPRFVDSTEAPLGPFDAGLLNNGSAVPIIDNFEEIILLSRSK